MMECKKEVMAVNRKDPRGGDVDEQAEEELREACGVIGCVLARNTPEGMVNVAKMIYLGLVALQHR